MVCKRRYFCGKNTVKCTVNTDKKPPLFRVEKYATNLEYFFDISHSGLDGVQGLATVDGFGEGLVDELAHLLGGDRGLAGLLGGDAL